MHDFQEQYTQRSKNMARRFTSSTEQEIEKLMDDKDSENTKTSTKVARNLFSEYLEGNKSPLRGNVVKRVCSK